VRQYIGRCKGPVKKVTAALPQAEGSALRPLAATLKALADEKRLQVLALLRRGEACVCEIEEVLGFSQTLVSHHLGVLRRAGLVRARRDENDGRWVYYSIDRASLARLNQQYLALLDVAQIAERVAHCDEEGNPTAR